MIEKDGGPAFPVDVDTREDGVLRTRSKGGMLLRDYFAAQALASYFDEPENVYNP